MNKIMNFKVLGTIVVALLIAVTTLTSVSNLAQSTVNPICPKNTSKYSNTFYCTDGKNIYGLFTEKAIESCKSLSIKSSLACTNKLEQEVTFNQKSYTVSLNRWSLSFFNWFSNRKFCPTSTTVLTNNVCKGNGEVYGAFDSVLIDSCLVENSAQTCLVNRLTIDQYNKFTPKSTKPPVSNPTTPAPTTPVIKPNVPEVIKPAPVTPTLPPVPGVPTKNQYDISKIIKVPSYASSVVYPTTVDYWNVIEGFDYSGNLKQIYNKENFEFKNGEIIMKAKKELTTNPVYSDKIDDERFYTKTAPYAGTKFILKDKFQWGHISFTAKFPNSSGTMPAIWLFDEVKGKHFTEIDLFEIPGSEKNNVYGVTHYGTDFKNFKSDHKSMNIPTLSTSYHKYDVYKTPEKVVTMIDGKIVYERNISNSVLSNGVNGLNEPLNLVMNLNIGDKWAGSIDDSKLPATMSIKDMTIEKYNY
jgi:beta-glucanase (GH16 family)